ncbi:hypothetical protein V8C86DRAFT_2450006 [Haematococcus lacustris]
MLLDSTEFGAPARTTCPTHLHQPWRTTAAMQQQQQQQQEGQQGVRRGAMDLAALPRRATSARGAASSRMAAHAAYHASLHGAPACPAASDRSADEEGRDTQACEGQGGTTSPSTPSVMRQLLDGGAMLRPMWCSQLLVSSPSTAPGSSSPASGATAECSTQQGALHSLTWGEQQAVVRLSPTAQVASGPQPSQVQLRRAPPPPPPPGPPQPHAPLTQRQGLQPASCPTSAPAAQPGLSRPGPARCSINDLPTADSCATDPAWAGARLSLGPPSRRPSRRQAKTGPRPPPSSKGSSLRLTSSAGMGTSAAGHGDRDGDLSCDKGDGGFALPVQEDQMHLFWQCGWSRGLWGGGDGASSQQGRGQVWSSVGDSAASEEMAVMVAASQQMGLGEASLPLHLAEGQEEGVGVQTMPAATVTAASATAAAAAPGNWAGTQEAGSSPRVSAEGPLRVLSARQGSGTGVAAVTRAAEADAEAAVSGQYSRAGHTSRTLAFSSDSMALRPGPLGRSQWAGSLPFSTTSDLDSSGPGRDCDPHPEPGHGPGPSFRPHTSPQPPRPCTPSSRHHLAPPSASSHSPSALAHPPPPTGHPLPCLPHSTLTPSPDHAPPLDQPTPPHHLPNPHVQFDQLPLATSQATMIQPSIAFPMTRIDGSDERSSNALQSDMAWPARDGDKERVLGREAASGDSQAMATESGSLLDLLASGTTNAALDVLIGAGGPCRSDIRGSGLPSRMRHLPPPYVPCTFHPVTDHVMPADVAARRQHGGGTRHLVILLGRGSVGRTPTSSAAIRNSTRLTRARAPANAPRSAGTRLNVRHGTEGWLRWRASTSFVGREAPLEASTDTRCPVETGSRPGQTGRAPWVPRQLSLGRDNVRGQGAARRAEEAEEEGDAQARHRVRGADCLPPGLLDTSTHTSAVHAASDNLQSTAEHSEASLHSTQERARRLGRGGAITDL